MKLVPFIALMLAVTLSNAQGNYAGSMKKLIGTKYKDSKAIAALKGYEVRATSLISDINDPESITVDHFQKGSDAVVFFSINEDPNGEEYTILDVLEYKSVPQGWQIKTAFCRHNEIENVEIVALVKSGTGVFLRPAKEGGDSVAIRGDWCLWTNSGLIVFPRVATEDSSQSVS